MKVTAREVFPRSGTQRLKQSLGSGFYVLLVVQARRMPKQGGLGGLHQGSGKPLRAGIVLQSQIPHKEDLKMKPALQWKPQDKDDAKNMRFRRFHAVGVDWSWPKRRSVLLLVTELEGRGCPSTVTLR